MCGVHRRAATPKGPPPECAVCLECIVHHRHQKRLECGHVFHRRCVKRWFERGQPTCPMCRAPCLADVDVSRLGTRLGYLLRLNPTPMDMHFGVHIGRLLATREIRDSLRLTREAHQLAVEVMFQSFSQAHFLMNLGLVGL